MKYLSIILSALPLLFICCQQSSVREPPDLTKCKVAGRANPWVYVMPDGIELRDDAISLKRSMSADELQEALKSLPPVAWPYGKIAYVQDQCVTDGIDAPKRIQENRAKVIQVLKSLGIGQCPTTCT